MSTAVSRRVDKLLASSALASHAPDFAASLHGLSHMCGFDRQVVASASLSHSAASTSTSITASSSSATTTATARRTLRASLQRESIALGCELIADFRSVERALATVERGVDALHAQCEALTAQLGAAKAQARSGGCKRIGGGFIGDS